MKAVPPREDRLVLEVIGVALREPANSSSVVAFRWLASEHGARGASHDRREKSRLNLMGFALLLVLIARRGWTR